MTSLTPKSSNKSRLTVFEPPPPCPGAVICHSVCVVSVNSLPKKRLDPFGPSSTASEDETQDSPPPSMVSHPSSQSRFQIRKVEVRSVTP